MASFEYQQRIERMYYRHGMFMSSHPTVMIIFSAVIILGCCYPLLNLPLPGSEPTEFLTPSSDFNNKIHTVGKDLPYEHYRMPEELPTWFQSDKQVAYIQQFLVKSIVHPWKEMDLVDAVKAPLAKIFTLLEEIENYHLEENEDRSITKQCYHVSESVIKPKKKIKPLFPEYGCLLMSPALFWSKNPQRYQDDPSIVQTIHKYQVKAIETSPSIKDLLFGVPSRESVMRFAKNTGQQTVVTYAITLVLKDYDHKVVSSLKKKLSILYPTKIGHQCKDGSNCENSSDSGGDVFGGASVITHIFFKRQIRSKDLVPLLSTYFLMGCYIYFSVRKINFVKSKLGMAFSAVVSVMASLMTSVGLCSYFGLKPILNGGEILAYLVIVIGLENILVITKSVVATPIHLEVNKRVALGLSREGRSITKNLLLELILIGLGYMSYIPEIQEFCAFALVGVLTDSFMHMVFFTSVLSIDMRRLDISEDMYMQPYDSDSDEEHVVRSKTTNRSSNNHVTPKPGKKRSVLEHLRAATKKRQRKNSDEIHKVETGGKKVTILKIPKRLRVLFFWADTRMVQRGLMVCLVIWFGLVMYGEPFGDTRPRPDTHTPVKFKLSTMPPVPVQNSRRLFKREEKEDPKDPLDAKGKLRWNKADLQLYRRLSFRHWPTLFAYYNITLAGRFVSILPTIPITVTVPPDDVMKEKTHDGEANKHISSLSDSASQEDNMGQQLSRIYYPMTGLDYYLTLLVGAVSGMMMVFFLTVLYRCICTRNYANWRSDGKRYRRTGSAKYKSSIGDTIPLVLAGHPQVVDCVICDDNLLASSDLSGEIRVWDIHTGACNSVIRRVSIPPRKNCSAERDINAKPSAEGYQENEQLFPPKDAPMRQGHFRQKSWHVLSQPQNMPQGRSSVNIPSPSNLAQSAATGMQSPLGSFSPEIDYSFSIDTDFASQRQDTRLTRRRGTSFSSMLTENESVYSGYAKRSIGYDFEGILKDSYLDQVSPDSGISSLGNLARYLRMDSILETPTTKHRIRTQSQPCLPSRNSLGAWHETALVSSPSQLSVSQLQNESSGTHAINILHPSSSPYSPGLTSVNSETMDEASLYEPWGSEIGQMSPLSFAGSQTSSPGSPVEVENSPAVWCMVGLQDFIITGCENGRIEVWNGKSGALKCTYEVEKEGVVGLLAEDKKIVAARVNGSLDFFELEATSFHVNTVQYRPRGSERTRHISNSLDDMTSGDILTLRFLNTVKSAHRQPITVFKMAMDRVVTGSCDHTLKVFTIQDTHCLFTLYGHKAPISSLFIDRRALPWAASGSSDGTIRLWDLLSGRCLHMLDDHKAEVTSLQCSDTHIVSIAQDDQLCVWTRAGVLLHMRCLDPGCSADMCLLGSSWCVTGGTGHILLWDLRNGELIRKIKLSEGTAGLTCRVTKLVPVANLAVACDTGKELQIVCFPSVLEKVD